MNRAFLLLLIAAAATTTTQATQAQAGDYAGIEWKPIERVDWEKDLGGAASAATKLQRPVIISNAPSEQWGARTKPWTPEFLAKHAAPSAVLHAKISESRRFGWGCCKVHRLSVRKFFDQLERGERHMYFSGPVSAAFGKSGGLMQDVGDVNVFDARETDHPELGDPESGTQNILWIGSKGALAPCHHDSMHNFYVQLHGRKRFRMFPPEEWKHLYLYPRFHLQHRNVQVDLRKGVEAGGDNVRAFPKLAELSSGFEAVLEPGDVLYLPPLWFHEVESLSSAAIAVNVWSPSFNVEKMNLAWEQDIPLDYVNWSRDKLLAITTFYVWTLTDMVGGKNASGILWDAVTTRYEKLYTSLDAVAAAAGDGDGEGVIDRLVTMEVGADGQATASSSPADPTTGSTLGARQPELTTPEALQHQDYIERIKSQPPFIDTRQLESDAREQWEKEQQDLEHADRSYRRPKRHPKDGKYKAVCRPQLVQESVRTAELQDDLKAHASRVAAVFMDMPYGMAEIYIVHYVEDLLAQLLGEDEVYYFLKQCLLY